ncbi:hypothetical protein LZ31DRAFT_293618 [Colletotrichum somersetense]|nr:hypothetical protein LZ31DRAFT_293618 [Colletotrichum somersetense]
MTSTGSSVPQYNLARGHFLAGHLAMHWAVAGPGRGLDRADRPGEVKCPWIADEVLRFFCSFLVLLPIAFSFFFSFFFFFTLPLPPNYLPVLFFVLHVAAVIKARENVVPKGSLKPTTYPQYGWRASSSA